MNDNVTNVVVAGIGGQGVLKASDILADTAFLAGLDVKKSEIHGMSQRGGSVTSDVRFGEKVHSPMVPASAANFLLVIEPDQVQLVRDRLAGEGVLIGPDAVDASVLSNARSLNVALLGVLSTHVPIEDTCWQQALRANLPGKLMDVNIEAFELGRKAAAG